jgi:hypothetical protein
MRRILLVHPPLPRSNIRRKRRSLSKPRNEVETSTYRCGLYTDCNVWVCPLASRGKKKGKGEKGLMSRFGWSGAYPEVHWFVPILFTSFFGSSCHPPDSSAGDHD